MGIIEDIRALPEAERLDAALGFIRDELMVDALSRVFWQNHYSLDPMQAAIYATLIGARGRDVALDRIISCLEQCFGRETSGETIKVHISKLRKKLAAHAEAGSIKNVWNFGYRLDGAEIPKAFNQSFGVLEAVCQNMANPNQNSKWRDEDDADLIAMIEAGSELWAVAEELERTQRACADRARMLRTAGKLTAPFLHAMRPHAWMIWRARQDSSETK